jgi:hypothetical protein
LFGGEMNNEKNSRKYANLGHHDRDFLS